MFSLECSSIYRGKPDRFKDVDTESLVYLYKDIEFAYLDINHALEHASATQSVYFSADAKSCLDTLSEIKCVLFTRGIKEFSVTEG